MNCEVFLGPVQHICRILFDVILLKRVYTIVGMREALDSLYLKCSVKEERCSSHLKRLRVSLSLSLSLSLAVDRLRSG